MKFIKLYYYIMNLYKLKESDQISLSLLYIYKKDKLNI